MKDALKRPRYEEYKQKHKSLSNNDNEMPVCKHKAPEHLRKKPEFRIWLPILVLAHNPDGKS